MGYLLASRWACFGYAGRALSGVERNGKSLMGYIFIVLVYL